MGKHERFGAIRKSARLGRYAVLAPLLVVLGAGVYGGAPARAADPAACQTPTNTVSGGGAAAISVGPGEVLLLTGGTFTGPVDALAGGGTLCVAAGAAL